MGNTDKFDRIADSYDTPDRVHIAEVSTEAIRSCLVDSRGKDAIDFGCGTGLVGMSLLDEFREVTFVDTSKNMLDIVDQKILRSAAGNARTRHLDFETSDHPDLRTDYVFMVQVLLHISDYEALLSKLYDILNDDGHLIIVDFNRNKQVVSDMVHPGFDQEALRLVLSRIGFRDIHIRTFYSGERIFMGQDASMFILDAVKRDAE